MKEDADAEWMHRRVRVVDEFCGGSPSLPPPLSLPFTVLNMLTACGCDDRLRRSMQSAKRTSPRTLKRRGSWSVPFEQLKSTPDDHMEADGREADLLSTTLPEGLVPQESANPDLIWLYDWVEEAEREEAAEQRATRTEHALDAIQQQLVETHATIAHALREHTAEVEAKIEKVHRDHAMEMEVPTRQSSSSRAPIRS